MVGGGSVVGGWVGAGVGAGTGRKNEHTCKQVIDHNGSDKWHHHQVYLLTTHTHTQMHTANSILKVLQSLGRGVSSASSDKIHNLINLGEWKTCV